MTTVPRLVVSAPSSGHGKTAVAVGLLAAFAAGGLTPAGFKIGPDHTDAAYLGLAAGRPGRNLDPRLVGPAQVPPLFAHGAAGADVAVVEGTMGLYDSLTGQQPDDDSTAGVAAALRAPVLLVVDVSVMGQSLAALVHGFRAYDELLWLGGVILNQVSSERHEHLLQEALDDIGVPVFGALRRGDLAALPARAHGVVPVLHGSVEAARAVRRLGEAVTEAVDLDGVLALGRTAPSLPVQAWSPAAALGAGPEPAGPRPVVALAGNGRDTYGYAETAELLAAAGADVVAVDPLRDEELPARTDALVVCGGLPESYAEELSANGRLRAAVAELARSGRPLVAEGAGLAWLAREFDGRPMCAVFDAVGVTTDRLVLGYRDATAQAASPLLPAGARITGFKQHRGAIEPRAGQPGAWSWPGSAGEGFVWHQVYASYLTLHWAGAPEMARRFVAAAGLAADPARGTSAGTGPRGAAAPGAGPGARQPSGLAADTGPTIEAPLLAPAGRAAARGRAAPAGSVPAGLPPPGGVPAEPAEPAAPPAPPSVLRAFEFAIPAPRTHDPEVDR